MADYTVNATLRIDADLDRARLQMLLDQGLRELSNIATRYGVTVTDGSAEVSDGSPAP